MLRIYFDESESRKITDSFLSNLIKKEKQMKEKATCMHRGAVKWNPDNQVVQCHNCGEIFVPISEHTKIATLETALTIYQLLKDAKTNGLLKARKRNVRCGALLDKVLTVLEKSI